MRLYAESVAAGDCMGLELLLSNILSAPVLFFVLGMVSVALRSDLDIPQPIPKILSLYLLMAIGFKGGVELRQSGVDALVLIEMSTAVVLATIVPVYAYWWLRRRLDAANSAAIAATYGSISAVTFITAATFLTVQDIPYGGHMIAAMALMESPAIIVGIILRRREGGSAGKPHGWNALLRDAFFNGSVVLLIGSLLIGILTGERGYEELHPFIEGVFKGVLCLFLLDMGIVATKRIGALREADWQLAAFAIVLPLINAAAGIAAVVLLGMPIGDGLLLVVLAASGSYIAVPAAMRLAIPEANPSIYVTLSLGVTFPFNIAFGIPLYMAVLQWLMPDAP